MSKKVGGLGDGHRLCNEIRLADAEGLDIEYSVLRRFA